MVTGVRIQLRLSYVSLPTIPNTSNLGLTSEEVTALRRKERKQFKIDRAQAMLNASLAAEAILTGKAAPGSSETVDEQDDSEIQRSGSPAPSVQSNATSAAQSNFRPTPRLNVTTSTNTAFIPSVDDYAHALPSGETRLTPQTFLVRPTRPDQRVGMKKRTPGTPQPAPAGSNPPGTPETPQPAMIKEEPASPLDPIEVEDLEHLQLNLEEAFFLSWAIGCLDVIHPATVSFGRLYDSKPRVLI
jgi:tRNA-splicing endonuclease subunit Sen2